MHREKGTRPVFYLNKKNAIFFFRHLKWKSSTRILLNFQLLFLIKANECALLLAGEQPFGKFNRIKNNVVKINFRAQSAAFSRRIKTQCKSIWHIRHKISRIFFHKLQNENNKAAVIYRQWPLLQLVANKDTLPGSMVGNDLHFPGSAL